MPTVPFTPRERQRQPVDEVYLAAAAADLHEAGMLFEPETAPEPQPKPESEA